jgi:thiamine-phosphate pyrophosphorylase
LKPHAIAMAKPQPAAKRPMPRLYLATPPVGEAQRLAAALGAATGAADVAAVLLRLKPDGERELIKRVKIIAAAVQAKDVALLLEGHADIVARAGADGAHLTRLEAFSDALETLKPERIAGCGGLATRDDAMLAAERGADYVMFGEPEASGRRPSFAAIVERVEWWAELFEIPCIGFAMEPSEIGPLARAGADFVAVGGSLWEDARGPAAAVAAAAAQLDLSETVP